MHKQMMSANLQIDAESIHIGPKINCDNAQKVEFKIKQA